MKSSTLMDSFNHAISGVIHGLKTERNMRLHIIAAVVAILSILSMNLTKIEIIVFLFAISLVLICEMFNTGIESIVDLIKDEYHKSAKVAKDISAGAVLIAAVNAIIAGYLIIHSHIDPLAFPSIITAVKQLPEHLTIFSLILVTLAVIIGKAITHRRGTFLHGGMPSGHTALAFSVWIVTMFTTTSILVTVLVFILSLIIAHSRITQKAHNTSEVIVGAIIGILITTLLFQIWG